METLRGGAAAGDSAVSQGLLGIVGRRLHLGGVSTCTGLVAALELRLDELDNCREAMIRVKLACAPPLPAFVHYI